MNIATPIESPLLKQIGEAMPLAMSAATLGARTVGLVIVDEVNGFATVGAGYLAPPAPNAQVARMVEETDRLAKVFTGGDRPILAFLDTHVPGKAEPPYPPHCEAGTGEENLVPELAWLEQDKNTTLVRKDCINGFVGSITPDGSNRVVDWVNRHKLAEILVVGICTDICVMDFVLTMLSARNHDMMPTLKEILVYDAGCSTYDLPRAVAEKLGLSSSAAHPQDIAHHMGLYFMHSRGAKLVNEVVLR
ncbi:MAG TPA: isochorismatase family protein [Candidatus Binatia bacterium]|nr:isochorismatase family protein [Candidatus Binatia bacterium]